MSGGGRACAAVIAVIAVLAVFAASVQGHPAAKQGTAKCPAGDLAAGVCVTPRASCTAHDAKLYAQRGLVCARGRLKEGGLAVQREGGAFAIGANGQVSLAETEQAFIAAFGPLPGVERVPGAVKLPPHADLTEPVLWIERDLPRLTAPQRRAVTRELARLFGPGSVPRGQARASDAGDTLVTELEPTLIAHISSSTGVTLPSEPRVHVGSAAELGQNPYVGGTNGGAADPVFNAAGEVVGCRIMILRQETATVPVATNVEGHELTHCFQFAAARTVAKINALPVYFVEGFAAWAGDQLELELDGVDQPDTSASVWIDNPFRSLFSRDYDAFPLYDEVAEEIGGAGYLWAHFQPLVAAGSATGIYQYLSTIAAPDFERNLATNSLLDPGLGPQWSFSGVGLGGQGSPDLREATVDNGGTTTLAAPSFAADRASVDLEADIVTITGKAPGGIRLSDGRTLDPEPTRLCDLADGCTCPNGSDPVDEGGQSGPAIAAIWGGAGGAKVTISGESLEEACAEGVPASAPPPSGSSKAPVRLENVQGQTIASFEPAASCSLSGGALTARLANRAGGAPMTVTLGGFAPGASQQYMFTDPSTQGRSVRYASYTTDAPVLGGDEEPANAGGGSYDGGTRFFLDAILFLPGTGSGGFAEGFFDCAALARGAEGG